jgi:L-ascorbate metabolism protein UlaG (beta-lactamase superfamily)
VGNGQSFKLESNSTKNHIVTQMKRRQFIKKSALIGTTILLKSTFAKATIDLFDKENSKQKAVKFLSNPQLDTILSAWKGTPFNAKGQFLNHEFPKERRKGAFWKWRFSKNPQKQERKNDDFRLPVLKTDAFLKHNQDTVVWLGHASFFVRINGINIVIDPVFDNIPMTKRWSEMPCDTAQFQNIDYILVSHSHYDHCDKSTLKKLAQLNPKAQFLTGLKLDKLLKKWSPNHTVQGAGWYQKFKTDKPVDIVFLPSRHRSNRGVYDQDETLWGAFAIKSGEKTVYFGGDSGYGSHYKEIATLFPNVAVAMIGIGAYSPRWFMLPNHHDPEQAAIAFNDTQAKVMIPMHYGTFEQTDEPRSEPPKLLQNLIDEGKIKNKVAFPMLGEDVFF